MSFFNLSMMQLFGEIMLQNPLYANHAIAHFHTIRAPKLTIKN